MKNIIDLKFMGKCEYDDSLKFKDEVSKSVIYVKSFIDGVLEINPICGNTISSVSQFVEKMFNDIHNVELEINSAFDNDEIQSINVIRFDFNGVVITADVNTVADDMVKQLYDGYEANEIKRKTEYEEYKKTPQYAIDMQEQARKQAERKVIVDNIIHIDNTTEMEFKDNEAKAKWDEFVEVNSKDGYSMGVVEYARRWAKYMQSKINNGNQLIDIADTTSHEADIGGITGFMYGCAVNSLSQFWKYGEELRKWHNKEYNYEGDGCVNPAILTVG